MLRSAFAVFVCGWVAWFMMDKPGPVQFSFPERSDELLGNFQYAFDMLKAGYADFAFIFIWKQHYIVLSLLGGALFAMLAGSVSDYLGRRRMRKLVLPGSIKRKDISKENEPGPASAPARDRELVGDKRVE
jgi:hypothetical protein